MVKTRLSVLKDGIFTPEDACELYKCMLLDVIDVCLEAFNQALQHCQNDIQNDTAVDHEQNIADNYELIISTTPATSVAKMEDLLRAEGFSVIKVICDSGSSFDEHYNDAFEQVWQMGADCILSMGADMPALTTDDVIRGFKELHAIENTGGIVLSPDQEMGVSIIGWPRSTSFDHTGVFYNPSGLTVLPAYIGKARDAGLAAIYLAPVPDVDTMADLAHNVTLVEALAYCDNTVSPRRTAAALADLGIEIRVPVNDLMDPRETIDL